MNSGYLKSNEVTELSYTGERRGGEERGYLDMLSCITRDMIEENHAEPDWG
jgi:hypothetical protein